LVVYIIYINDARSNKYQIHVNRSSGNRVGKQLDGEACRWTDGRTDTYLIGAFRDYSKAPKRRHIFSFTILHSCQIILTYILVQKSVDSRCSNTVSAESNYFCSSLYYIIPTFSNSS